MKPWLLACFVVMIGCRFAYAQPEYKLLKDDAAGADSWITKDIGGVVNAYEQKYFGAGSENHHWVVDGYCNSACTMVLGTANHCATEHAAFGFHAGYTILFPFFWWKVIVPQVSAQMRNRYPAKVQAWVDANHALGQITPLTFLSAEHAMKFDPKYGVVKGRVEDFVPPCTPHARALARP